MRFTTRSNAGRLAAFAATATAVGLFGFGSAAQAEEPGEESRTVVTNLVNHPDSGAGSPEMWALDAITRTFDIVGGPEYVRREQQPSLVGADEPDPPADVATQVAEAKKEPEPEFNVCDLVKKFHLKWQYHADGVDKGTFKTLVGATRSPEAGAALLGDVPGTVVGGFSADFIAPAHWCSFDDSDLAGTIDTGDAPRSSGWVTALFGEKAKGDLINDDWAWTYTTCSEKWVNSGEGNSGDITGKPCPTTPAPTTSAPPAVVTAQLPVTGASVTSPAVIGGVLVVVGAALLAGLALTRRRRAA